MQSVKSIQLTQLETAKDSHSSIISKCWEDSKFKAKLVANPIETIESFIGQPINIPEGKRLVVVDQSQNPNVLYFNIPAEPNLDDFELTDEELEAVAGGSHVACFALGMLIMNTLIYNGPCKCS